MIMLDIISCEEMKFIYNLQVYNTIFELINSYWVETLKAMNNATLKYLWWKVDFKKQLINGLKKKNRFLICLI